MTPRLLSCVLSLCSLGCPSSWSVPDRIGLPDVHPPPRNPPDRLAGREVWLDDLSEGELQGIADLSSASMNLQGVSAVNLQRADLDPGAPDATEVHVTNGGMDLRRSLYYGARSSGYGDSAATEYHDVALPLCPATSEGCNLKLRPGTWRIGVYESRAVTQEIATTLALDERPVEVHVKPYSGALGLGSIVLESAGLVTAIVAVPLLVIGNSNSDSQMSGASGTAKTGTALLVGGGLGVVGGLALSFAAQGTVKVRPLTQEVSR